MTEQIMKMSRLACLTANLLQRDACLKVAVAIEEHSRELDSKSD